ncbi:MAG: FAD-dependent monooxygenase [Pseudonocardiaceae bacterium]
MSASSAEHRRQVEAPVLIVGAGGSGLAASIFLSDLGIRSLLVERHRSTSKQPRAHLLNARTMEVLGQHGLAEDVYRAGAPQENCGSMVWLTSLGGDGPLDRRMLYRTAAYGGGELEPVYAKASGYRHGNLGQRWLEPLLVQHARQRQPDGVLFGHELVDFDSDEDGITATVINLDGEPLSVRATYLIGADGGKTIGNALGVRMLGSPTFLDWVSLHVRADFSELIPYDDAVVIRIACLTDDGRLEHCGVVPMGPTRWGRHSEEWTIMFCVPPGSYRGDDLDDDSVVRIVRNTLKLPVCNKLDVLSISRWPVEGKVAERLRSGRVFLVGDAAHRHPPSGALGLNTGIQDSHNLAWKLATVLHGRAHEDLLESYELERRPVAHRVVEHALFALFNQIAITAGTGVVPGAHPEWNRGQLAALFSNTPDGETRRALLFEYFNTNRIATAHLAVEMGFDYADSGFVLPDGTARPAADPMGLAYPQIARPGHRLPHAWLTRGADRVSPHDLIKPGSFLLLTGDGGHRWLTAAAAVNERYGVGLTALAVGAGHDLRDVERNWARLRGHDEDGAILVRPDGFVAMRALDVHTNPEIVLEKGLSTALGYRSTTMVHSAECGGTA